MDVFTSLLEARLQHNLAKWEGIKKSQCVQIWFKKLNDNNTDFEDNLLLGRLMTVNFKVLRKAIKTNL